MGVKRRQSIVIMIAVLMLGMSMLPQAGSSPLGGDEGFIGDRNDPIWTDPLDDLSHVYVPGAGLQGVEVSGGSAHLKTGSSTGWIASEVITCPPGYRYDLVMLEVDTPGDSRVFLSILNASADPSEVGFANETIATYKLMNVTDFSMGAVSPVLFPAIRIQVNLEASGTDRPSLLSWTLQFIGQGVWRDDFMGTGKMDEHTNLNFTGDTLEVDLTASASGGGSGVGDYDPYPTLAIPGYQQYRFLYPNAGNTGYQDEQTIPASFANDVAITDLDHDGDLDVLFSDNSADSPIFWGDSSGTYSTSRQFDLDTTSARSITTGDFNGDGWAEICVGSQSTSKVWTNDGTGTFNTAPDTTINTGGYYSHSGDFNGDGYDDLLLGYSNCNIYMGGPTGISTTADVTLAGYYPVVEDLDLDGFADVVTVQSGTGIRVFMGKASGIDAVAEYTFSGAGSALYYPSVGDVDGDGYIDILGTDYHGANDYRVKVFAGGSDGWKSSRVHTAYSGAWSRTKVADIDKDGSGDVIVTMYTGGSYTVDIYSATPSWTFSRLVKKDVSGYIYGVAAAIPKGSGGGPKAIRGTFTTVPITIPDGMTQRWDVAYLEGTFPEGTSAKISVLDGNSGQTITGYKDLAAMDVDLGGITVGSHNSIKLEVTIMTEVNTTTPVLDSLTVKWMDNREWRDEFYGPAKVGRMLNMDVSGGTMQAGAIGGQGPQLIFPSLLGDANYTTSAKAYVDDGGADYLARDPFDFKVKGTTDADVADVNGDGFMDLAFAIKQTDNDTFDANSPLFMGGPMGIQNTPQHRFDTTGATGIVMEDIDGDGFVDVVFSQEQKSGDYTIASILYWGSADGFADTPDLEFSTTGAWDVEVVDVDDDDLLDLVFACHRDATSTSTDSMVFLQDGTDGFCATVPDHLLPTKGAHAVASGDIDKDGHMDMAFANGLSGGFAEIDSYVYWGKAGGGFETTPLMLATKGAEDVLVADLNGDGDLDIVFANHWDNSQNLLIDSYIFMGSGSRTLGPDPDERLPTQGATGIAVADIDGTGWMDLVFSNQKNGSSYQVPSYVYLGGASGWPPVPDVRIPTEGAYAVLAADFVGYGTGGYLSKAIYIDLPERDTGTVHTFRYTATVGAAQRADLMLVDADSWEVLASTRMTTGSHDWDLKGLFRVKEHRAVRVMLVASGLEAAGQFTVDQLWFNWTKRVPVPPTVLDMGLSVNSTYRTQEVDMWLDVTDDYDLPDELTLQVEHRVNGTDTWDDYLVGIFEFDDVNGLWRMTMIPKVNAALGTYDFRVSASDLDSQYAVWMEFPNLLEVLNNMPTTPVVRIAPSKAVTTSTLNIEFDVRSSDVETAGLTYNFSWYKDGVLMPDLRDDNVPSFHTSRGQNWSVEVRAWDGDEMSLPGSSWVLINNTPPQPKDVIPDPELNEDTVDSEWINLMNAFQDNDGDALIWSLGNTPEHISVEIDHVTGTVTITPEEHWFGEEDVIFVASDGEFSATQTVTVMVLSVNDIPWIATVDGKAVTGDLEYTVSQGATLVITYATDDIEGDEVQADVSATTVVLDESARTITFEPGVDAVGTFTFVLRVWDVESPGQKVSLSFTIEVENENDPMEVPKITHPLSGASYRVNQSFTMQATCDDPDIQFGQELEFVWVSNISGEIGRGSSITAKILEPGTHLITLTVSDPDFSESTTITLTITPKEGTEPPPPPDDDDDEPGTNWLMIVGILVAVIVVGAVLFIVTGKSRTERYEEKMDAQEEAEEKRVALERTRDAIKDLADEWEDDVAEGETKAKAEAAGWEAEDEGYEEIEMGHTEGTLSMEASVTEEASDDVKALFTGTGAVEAERTDEEKEAMRVENEKRQYQNAIGRLPYGIPSKELADKDWVELASCLATCEKKTVEGGKEVAQIDGRWYYSDREDTGTFLKEHGKKKEERAPKAPTSDKEKLLAKLEERFILGEISEDTYKELKKKYGG
jgi:uncharacterized membrane protein